MHSLARRWPVESAVQESELSGAGRRCNVQIKTYISRHSDGVARQDLREKIRGKGKGSVLKIKKPGQNDNHLAASSSTAATTRDVDLTSRPVGIVLTPPRDTTQTSRIARLEYQLQNRAESLRKLLEVTGEGGLKDTPFRHRLSVLPETGALTTRSEPPDLGDFNGSDKWLPHTSVHRLGPYSDTLSWQDSQAQNYRERSPRRVEHADFNPDQDLTVSDLVYQTPPSQKDGMKTNSRDDVDRDHGFLPVINITGNLALVDTCSETSCSTRSTCQGLRPNKLSSPFRKPLNNLSGGYISGKQITDNSEPDTQRRKSTKVTSPTPTEKDLYQNIISSYSQKNYHSPQMRTKKNSKRRKKRNGDSPPSSDIYRTTELPPVDTIHRRSTLVCANNNLSPSQQADRPNTDLRLAPEQVIVNDTTREADTLQSYSSDSEEDIGPTTAYNFVGTSSKVGRTKTYTLKELADIYHERNLLCRDTTSDRMWKSKVHRDQRVFDVSSYDSFARKPMNKSSQISDLMKPGVSHESSRVVNRDSQNKLKNDNETFSKSNLSSQSLSNKVVV